MDKLANDLRIAMLAFAGGLFSISVYLLSEHVSRYYSYLSEPYEARHEHYYYNVEPWLPISIWHALVFVVAAFIAHRYFVSPKRSPFLLWQMIGIMVLTGWVLTLLVITGLDYSMNPHPYVFERMLSTFLSWNTARFAATVFAGNVIYASLIHSATEHYGSQTFLSLGKEEASAPVRQTSVCRLIR